MIDTDDIDNVRDIFMDRLVDIQVEDGIPVNVNVSQPPERVRAQFRESQEEQWQAHQKFASLPARIVQDPAIMRGNPVVKGTLVQVEMVLAHLARTADFNELLSLYPELTMDDVSACLAFARTLVAAAGRVGRTRRGVRLLHGEGFPV